MSKLRILKRFLRSPKVIVGEIVGIAFAGVLGATLPQVGIASAEEIARFRQSGPGVSTLVDAFALDHVFQSGWFLAITLLATVSLSIVITEQIRRLRVMWPKRPTEAQFRRAPFRAEFERPARLGVVEDGDSRRVEMRTKGRLGLAGSPLFHMGLLLIIIAAGLRALFAVDAVVDLIEGETLPPTAEAWAAEWPGVLAKPFRLDYPVTLDAVRATRYETGGLRDLRARLSLKLTEGVGKEEIAINREVQVPGGRLFMSSYFGPAALIEWRKDGFPSIREAVLLARKGKRRYEGSLLGPDGVQAHLRVQVDKVGNRPTRLELRVLKGVFKVQALQFAGLVRVGEVVSLPDGQILKLHGLPFWARLYGSRDPSLWLAYAGFGLVLAGATIMFTLVKVDMCVRVTPVGDKERIFVALRAQRFTPLFQERFQRLVREQGGPA